MPDNQNEVVNPNAPTAEETAYRDNASKIAAELVAKLGAEDAAASAPAAAVAAPAPAAAVVATPAASAAPPAPDAFQEKLLARIAEMEARLAAAQAQVPAPKPTEPAQSGIDPQELWSDLPGVLKRLGIPNEYAARAFLGAVNPEALNPSDRANAVTQAEIGRLRNEFAQLAEANRQLRSQVARGEYRTQVTDYASEIKPETYPAVAAAMKNNPKYVMGEVMRIAQDDARTRLASGDKGAPISPADAVKRLEDSLQTTARLLGATVGAPATAQPAAVAPPAASKPAPIVPAASAISPSAPSTGSTPVSWEAFQEQVRNELVRKYDTN